jgi:hypothetical protein
MDKVNTTERLTQLRQLMSKHNVDVYSRLANISSVSSVLEVSTANFTIAVKSSLLKTATLLNTLPHVTLAALSSRGSLAPLAVLW